MDRTARASFPALGSEAVVLTTDPRRLRAACLAVAGEVQAIDRACSRFREDSELTMVNRARGRSVAVGELLLEALEVALRAARQTDGDVDPPVGLALETLGYDRDFAAVPATAGPPPRFAAVPGWRRVHLDRGRGRVRVPAGVRLDLGATAKALAADRAAARAGRAAGCGVLVSLGGDLAIAGQPPAGGWAVRVADWHRAGPDAEGQTIRLRGGGLATSSTTVRRWTRGGERLHHLVDPATGGPARVVWRTVSVAAGNCVDANTAATAAIVRGERAPGWLDAAGLPARLVRPDGSIVRVGGWPEPEEASAA